MMRTRPQRGVALVNAIFLIVVLAALGAYMVSIGGVQTAAVTKSLQTARVYFGAKAGLEWAIHRAVNPPVSMCGVSPATQATAFTLGGNGFVGVNVSVNCTFTTHDEDDPPGGGITTIQVFNVYYITSTATHGSPGDVDYAERRLEATVTNRFR